jgi:hypothetical protein
VGRNFADTSAQYLEYAAKIVDLPCTFTARVRFTGSSVGNRVVFSQGSSSGARVMLLQLNNTTGKLQLYAEEGTSVNFEGATSVSSDVWHHVAGVFASGNYRIYLNGGTADGTNGGTTVPSTLDRANIGTRVYSGTAADYMLGDIAAVAWFNVALTEAEITALAGGAPPLRVRPGSLVGWWELHGDDSPEPDWHPASADSGRYPMTLGNAPTKSDVHAPVSPWWQGGSMPEAGAVADEYPYWPLDALRRLTRRRKRQTAAA